MRFVVAILLLTAFVWVSVSNWTAVWRRLRYGQRGFTLPVVGGLCGMLGVLLLPIASARPWWWVPFVLDGSTLPLLIVMLGRRRRAG